MEKIKYTVNRGSITQINNVGDNKIEFSGNLILEKNGSEKEQDNSKKEESKCEKLKKCLYRQLSKHFLIGIIVILLGVIIFNKFYKITCANNVTLILSFVGILATFIVISNYAQVKEIKDDFDRRINDIDKKFKEEIKSNNKYSTNYVAAYSFLSNARVYRDMEDYKVAFYYYLQSIIYVSTIKTDTLLSDFSDEFFLFTDRLTGDFTPLPNKDIYVHFMNATISENNDNLNKIKKIVTELYNKI